MPAADTGILIAVVTLALSAVALAVQHRRIRRATAAADDARALAARRADDLGRVQSLLQEYMHQREAEEERLRESEAQYRMLAESIDDVVSLVDLDGTALYFSPSVEKMLGWTAGELVGRDVFAMVHPEDRERIAGDTTLAVLMGGSPPVESRSLRKDGSWVWVETHTTLVRDARGAPERLIGVTRTIEQRKLAQEALRQSEERLRALIDRAAYGIFRETGEGRFLEVNPALVAILGYESAADLLAIADTRALYTDPAQRDEWIAAVEAERREFFELAWRRRDGAPVLVRLSVRAARDAHGAVLYYEGIAENVTERLRREAVVRRAERMASLGDTLAGVAHELNNPLAAISGFAQILLKTPLPQEDLSAVDTIHREAKRAARVVKDLLTFARRESSRERSRVDLNGIVRYIVDTQRYAMETRGIHTELDLAPGSAEVAGDAAHLEQVVLNLVVNARQALDAMEREGEDGTSGIARPAHPTVLVRTAVHADRVVLEVSDNGPGIPAAVLPRIWDPFVTTKPEGEGTGLGLSVVHGIVIDHGGSVDVTTAVGQGATFLISFPRTDGSQIRASDGDGERAAPAVAARPLDLLVVDDEVVIADLLQRYFASRGHAVMTARDGEEALRLAHLASFDVVICDLRMPGMDGSEVIRRLHDIPTLSDARFILSTGDTASAAVRARIASLPLAAVMDKPYDMEVLRRVVEVD